MPAGHLLRVDEVNGADIVQVGRAAGEFDFLNFDCRFQVEGIFPAYAAALR